MVARTQVIIRKPDAVAMQWNAIVLPFCWQLWVAVGVAMVVLVLCLATTDWLIRHYSNDEDRNVGFAEAVFIVYSAICQQGM
jgi:nucleoside diphosphate kinase